MSTAEPTGPTGPAEAAGPAGTTGPLAPADLFSLADRVAVVTGASSGLGERFARVLHQAGARVVVSARRADRLDTLVADLPGTVAVPADVTADDDRRRIIDTTLAEHGHIDVLVNNAGISGPVAAEDEPLDRFREVLDVNLTSLFALCQLAAHPMLEREQGSIVNIASVLGSVASAPIKQASYAASKGGVVNLTRELGAEWGRRGVRVNAIAPGWFPSEMNAEMFEDERSLAFIARNAPMGRAGRTDELDGALLYLASDASTYVTGSILTVDGGWTAR